MTTIRVAAVQAASKNGALEFNLAHAEQFVREAATAGAELVLCPEFLAPGYIYDEAIWDFAEPAGGATETWLSRLARELGLLIGASYLEARGDDFFNTFSLFGPGGQLLGRVRKGSLPFGEGWYFAASSDSKIIPTPFGKVAVGICNDNQTSTFLCHVQSERPVLILMPHSWPTQLGLTSAVFRRPLQEQLGNVARRYASSLGVPVVMANKFSSDAFKSPFPLVPGMRLSLKFDGHSSICDGTGACLAELPQEEGVIVADVRIDPQAFRPTAKPDAGYWSFPPSTLRRTLAAFQKVCDALGRRAYRNNPRRVGKARAHQLPSGARPQPSSSQ
jgi:N-carbamoylputrescine amidase